MAILYFLNKLIIPIIHSPAKKAVH